LALLLLSIYSVCYKRKQPAITSEKFICGARLPLRTNSDSFHNITNRLVIIMEMRRVFSNMRSEYWNAI